MKIEYEYIFHNGRFIAYCHDTVYNKKMVVFGNSHTAICQNFAVLLYRKGIAPGMYRNRFIQAQQSNPTLIEKFGNLKRGGFLDNNENVITAREIKAKNKKEQEDIDERAKQLIENDNLEKQFDSFISKVTEDGTIEIYGIKLVKTYKGTENGRL